MRAGEQKEFLLALERETGEPLCLANSGEFPGIHLFLCDEVSSTMDVARDLFRGTSSPWTSCGKASFAKRSGIFVASDRQTAGRGRANRVWNSPKGDGIYCTLTVEPQCSSKSLQGLSLAIGLAVRETVCSLGVEALLKWPNDVQVKDENGLLRKLSGILVEAQHLGRSVVLSIGVGLNLVANEEIDLVGGISLQEISRGEIAKGIILAKLFQQVVQTLQRFEQRGFAVFRDDWLRHSSTIGKVVRIAQGDEFVEGKAIGIDIHGALEVQTGLGIQKFCAGELLQPLAD